MRAVLLSFVFALVASIATAQGQGITSPVLTIDTDEVYQQSLFGQQLRRALERQTLSLAAENRQIEAELVAEERQLTDERQALDPEEFRAKAKAFDEKVVALRDAQDEKARTLRADLEAIEQQFLQAIFPILAQITRERGAVVVLEERSVFLAAGQVDITQEAITRIDAQLAKQTEPDPSEE